MCGCRINQRVVLLMIIVLAATAAAVDADAPLRPARTVIGPDERMLIEVFLPANASTNASLRLAWMDEGGERLHPALVPVEPGSIDLASIFPDLPEHRHVSYVQLYLDGRAIGSALTVQPILEPIVARMTDRYRADGTTYPFVTGWRTKREVIEMAWEAEDDDERDDEREETDEPDERDETDEPDPERPPIVDRGRPAEEALADPSRTLNGFRLYIERDVILDTSFGEIRIVLRPDHAPETVWNFRELVQRGFYDGLTFHRIVPMTAAGEPFVIQAGDPTGKGHGGPGYELPLEPSGLAHDFGVISMARGDTIDSAGSQFFICLSRTGTAALDGQYAAFGYAVAGREAILAIADGPLEDVRMGRPRWPVVIHHATLVDAPPRTTGVGRTEQFVQRQRPQDDRPAPPRRVPR